MSPMSPLMGVASWGFPRVSGDEPLILALQITLTVFSPRERG